MKRLILSNLNGRYLAENLAYTSQLNLHQNYRNNVKDTFIVFSVAIEKTTLQNNQIIKRSRPGGNISQPVWVDRPWSCYTFLSHACVDQL